MARSGILLSSFSALVRLLTFTLVASSILFCQQPPSDPQAVTYAAQSIAALTGNLSINDVTLTGNAVWSGSPNATGATAMFRALGANESRIDLTLSAGIHTEIRDAQTGIPLGKWINPDGKSGPFSPLNCWTDAAWFFPALGSLASGTNIVLSYVGQETRNGEAVQHIQAYRFDSLPFAPRSAQEPSKMDFYLDANTFLPVAETFNVHPDNNNAMANLVTEVDFSNYQNFGSVLVPTRIQRYQQGNLMLDVTVTGASFNTGLSISIFAINSASGAKQ